MISDICVTFHTEFLVIIFDFFKSPQNCDYIVSLLLKEFLTRKTDHLPFLFIIHDWNDTCSQSMQAENKTIKFSSSFPKFFNIERRRSPTANLMVVVQCTYCLLNHLRCFDIFLEMRTLLPRNVNRNLSSSSIL